MEAKEQETRSKQSAVLCCSALLDCLAYFPTLFLEGAPSPPLNVRQLLPDHTTSRP